MARLSSGWRDGRRDRARGAQQWQPQGAGLGQGGGPNYQQGGHGRYENGNRHENGNRYDSNSGHDAQGSPRYNEGSSRHEGSSAHDERAKFESSPKSDGSKYGGSAKYDADKKYEAGHELEQSGSEEEAISTRMLSALENKITALQQEMSEALHDATSKDTVKYDLIFSILIELQSRQGKLEESVRALKTQFERMGGAGMGQTMQLHSSPAQQQQGHMQSSGGSPSNGSPSGPQVSSPMGQQQMCFPAGQMPYGNTVAADGSMPMVFVMNSPNGSQMCYAMPQVMSPTGSMQAMQQQMVVQFMPQEQGQPNEEYQWGGSSTAGAGSQTEIGGGNTSSSGAQPAEVPSFEVPVADGEKRKTESQFEEE